MWVAFSQRLVASLHRGPQRVLEQLLIAYAELSSVGSLFAIGYARRRACFGCSGSTT